MALRSFGFYHVRQIRFHVVLKYKEPHYWFIYQLYSECTKNLYPCCCTDVQAENNVYFSK